MGAEVIKVESDTSPDLTRTLFVPGRVRPGRNLSAENTIFNYGKKGVTLDMDRPRALELAKRIVKLSDIVIDNYSGPVMRDWGLGYDDIKKIRPDTIVYSGSGFGRTGPYRDFPAHASQAEAFSGLWSVAGYIGSGPVSLSYGWNDINAAVHGVFAILAVLHHRNKTGQGQYIDLSMTESGAAQLGEAYMDYAMNQRQPERMSNRDKVMAPHGAYRCRGEDKWVAIAIDNDQEWRAFGNALGNPDWTRDERFDDTMGRYRNQDEIDRLISAWTIDLDHQDVVSRLQPAGVMAGASLDMGELLADPHLEARGFFNNMEHPEMGPLHLPGLPWRLSDCPRGNYQRPPLLGEHNDYVFGQLLGMSREEIDRLITEEVIY